MQKNPDAMWIAAGLLDRRPELADFFDENMLQNGGKHPRDMDWSTVCPKQGRNTQVYNISTGMEEKQLQDAWDDNLRILGDERRPVMRRWKDNRTNDGRKSYTNYIGQTGREDGNERKEEHQDGDVQVQFCDRFRRGLETYGGETDELEM
jgi:hypothetical protein